MSNEECISNMGPIATQEKTMGVLGDKMTKEENLKLAYELKSEVEKWVDRSFNFIHLSVYEKMADDCLLEYIEDTRTEEEIEADYELPYPVWNTLFEFRDSYFNTSDEMQEKAVKCGFGLINGMDDFNLTLFVSGCGYSFYSVHWIPLYLSWFEDEGEKYKNIDYSMV